MARSGQPTFYEERHAGAGYSENKVLWFHESRPAAVALCSAGRHLLCGPGNAAAAGSFPPCSPYADRLSQQGLLRGGLLWERGGSLQGDGRLPQRREALQW